VGLKSVPHRGSEWVRALNSLLGPTRYRDVVLTSYPSISFQILPERGPGILEIECEGNPPDKVVSN